MTASTSTGMNAVDAYAGELRDAEDAVGRCFDVNEDMARVIAVAAEGAAAAIERSGDNNELDARRSSIIIDESREERLLFDGGRTPTVGGVDSAGSGRSRMEEKSSTERAGVRAWPKSPWEEAAAATPRRRGRGAARDHRADGPPSPFSSPTDLSSYSQKGQQQRAPGARATTRAQPRDARDDYGFTTHHYSPLAHPTTPDSDRASASLPRTPPTPGKYNPSALPTMISRGNEKNVVSHHTQLPAAAAAITSSMSYNNRHRHHHQQLQQQQQLATGSSPEENHRKEKARMRVQQYLSRIDDKIRNVKAGRTTTTTTTATATVGRASMMRGQSDGVVVVRGSNNNRISTAMASSGEQQQHEIRLHHTPTCKNCSGTVVFLFFYSDIARRVNS